MVQTNQMISYLDTTAMPRQASSKTSSGDETQSEFSKALDQELSADKQPVDDKQTEEAPKAEKDQAAEGAQKPEAEQSKEQSVDGDAVTEAAVVVPWMMQAPMVQQMVTETQMTTAPVQLVDTGVQQQAAVAVTLTEGEALTGKQEKASVVPIENGLQNVDAEGGVVRQTAGEMGIVKQAVQTSQQIQQAAGTVEAQPLQTQNVMQAEQPLQTGRQSEVQTVANTAEVMPQATQGQQTQTVHVQQDVPKPAQGQTVNMGNPQEGVQNLGKMMAQNLTQGKNEFEIWMEPANLGKIGVKVAYEGGRAMISIMCMSEKAMEIVSQNAKTLGVIVQQNTGNDTIVVVEQQERQDYLQREAEEQNRGGNQHDQQKDGNRNNNEQELENESFLQQLRLGLM